ncbi:hypothetical protein MN032_17910 [Agromyces atrinae]|uniref:hypothetical protein n=1 Tax=Agromyces atrinae TaxID=592376 RepID=UPI001F587861|nr:hypothetical protein [Agromyces atrinae]MCI2959564.1 hypothetical protein [Agromyces atrinae]
MTDDTATKRSNPYLTGLRVVGFFGLLLGFILSLIGSASVQTAGVLIFGVLLLFVGALASLALLAVGALVWSRENQG